MSQVAGLTQYRANALTSPYASPARTGKSAPVDIRRPRPGTDLAKASSAGDTVEVSETAQTRAQVQAATKTSQKAQAGVTTARAVEVSLNKASRVLTRMQDVVQQIAEGTGVSRRSDLGREFGQLSKVMDRLSEQETFAGHKVLDGKFKVSFSVSENSRVTIDATLPSGRSYSAAGLGLTDLGRSLAPAEFSEDAAQAQTGGAGATKPAVLDRDLPELVEDLDAAVAAVDQVRAGVGRAAASMVEALNGPEAPFGPPVEGATQLAHKLVALTQARVLEDSRTAMTAQANISQSSALRLLT